MYWSDHDPFPVRQGTEFSYEVQSYYHEGPARRNYAWKAMRDDPTNDFLKQTLPNQEARTTPLQPLQIIYQGSCLTKANLEAMKAFEDSITGLTSYQDNVCQKTTNGLACETPRSVLRFFDGTYSGLGVMDGAQNVFASDPNFDRISSIMSTAYEANGNAADVDIVAAGNPNLRVVFDYVVGADYNSFTMSAGYCRTMFPSGYPLSGYRTIYDSPTTQKKTMETRHADTFDDVLDDLTGVGTMDIYYSSEGLLNSAFRSNKNVSFGLMGGSIMLAFFCMIFLTRSIWLTAMTFVTTLGSCAWANLLYRIVFQMSILPKSKHKPSARSAGTLFFSNTAYTKTIGNSWVRWVILALGAVVFVAFLLTAAIRFERDRNQPAAWREEVNFQRFQDLAQSKFPPSDEDYYVQVDLIWGLDELSRGSCPVFDTDCLGTPEYNKAFDLTSSTSQKLLQQLCEDLKAASATTVNDLYIRRSSTYTALAQTLEVQCFMDAMANSPTVANNPVPYTAGDMQATMTNLPAVYPAGVYNATSFNSPISLDTYYRSVEIGVLNWLSNNGDLSHAPIDFVTYAPLMGGIADSTLKRTSSSLLYAGDYGSYLRYAAIRVNLTLNSVDVDYKLGLQVMRNWDDYLARWTTGFPRPLTKAFQTASKFRTWEWMVVQENLIGGIFQGLGLGILLVFLTLCVFGKNWIVALLSSVCVLLVIILVAGIVAFAGWSWGFLESLNFAVVIAVSVDCIVHTAICYTECVKRDRIQRTQYALTRVGYPVFIGSAVAFFSSLFLCGTSIMYFFEFAIFFLSTTGFAMLYGILFFPALLHVIGPEGHSGMIFRNKSRILMDSPSHIMLAG